MTKGKPSRPKALYQIAKVLWHLDVFRRSFRELSGHVCMKEACIFCALKELFYQLQFSKETVLPPDSQPKGLIECFFDQNGFQLGLVEDATECFENILRRIHTHIAQDEEEDICNARHCITHQKFAMILVEQSVCRSCGASSETLSYTQMVHYVSTSALVYQGRLNADYSKYDRFGIHLRRAGGMGEVRKCSNVCGTVIQVCRTLTNRPDILSIGLVWNSERPTFEHVMEVLSIVDTSLRVSDVFTNVVDQRWGEQTVHELVGMVTYHGKHYSTFFFHTELRIWIHFDDTTVSEVGTRWDQVVEKCRKGRNHPLLLLYSLSDGTPVDTFHAPKQVTTLSQEWMTHRLSQTVLKRSVTPSPEKPAVCITRRAITPNIEGYSMSRDLPLIHTPSEYQNTSFLQKHISQQTSVADVPARRDDFNIGQPTNIPKIQTNIHRTLSNGSSSGLEGMFIPEQLNVPGRRDSGNWSGDRTSACSTSTNSMENPYSAGKLTEKYKVSKNQRTANDQSVGRGGINDAGYDSYSLSSNDSSSMTTLEHLMRMGHLAKIPEDYGNSNDNQNSPSCEILCEEADELLIKSRQLENEHDLVLALALCNAAASKARAATKAPYNNPQLMTMARMKHNTCIMRARSLHRRIENERDGNSSSHGRHSRQNSKDSDKQSKQSTKKPTVPWKDIPQPTKNIEIYATLPKKHDPMKTKLSRKSPDIEPVVIQNKSSTRESRSMFAFSKNTDRTREKRSKSEDRNKLSQDFSVATESINLNDTINNVKDTEVKVKEEKSKKQHKIKRKLLMGGFMKRKNRSMPDLTDAVDCQPPSTTKDENCISKDSFHSPTIASGYLSEGHLESSENNPNPNLERSKLMRKNFHSSIPKILTPVKVPPPPPLRTTSHLSANPSEPKVAAPRNDVGYAQNVQCLPKPIYSNNDSFSDESFYDDKINTLVTRAMVHSEQKQPHSQIDTGTDVVDGFPPRESLPHLELPPYPSPMGSVVHSRQGSEDFPPPPPPLDLSSLEEHLPFPQMKSREIVPQYNVTQSTEPISYADNYYRKQSLQNQAIVGHEKNHNGSSHVTTDPNNRKNFLFDKIQNVPSHKFESSSDRIRQESYDQVDSGGIGRRMNLPVYPDLAQKYNEFRRQIPNTSRVQGATDDGRMLTKKKSVSFCDQVILVATADEEDDHDVIPNPILERVLRTALTNNDTDVMRQDMANVVKELQSNTPHTPHASSARNLAEAENKEYSYCQKYLNQSSNGFVNAIDADNAAVKSVQHSIRSSPFLNDGLNGSAQRPSLTYQNEPCSIKSNRGPLLHPAVPTHVSMSHDRTNTQFESANSSNNQLNVHAIYGYQVKQPFPAHLPYPDRFQQGNFHQGSVPSTGHPSEMEYLNTRYMRNQYERVPVDTGTNAGRFFNPQRLLPNEMERQHIQSGMVPAIERRVPSLHLEPQGSFNQGTVHPTYESSNQLREKIAGFESKPLIGIEATTPRGIVVPIKKTNISANIECNLCRKKYVLAPMRYCRDCEFYMSKFKGCS
ncbi:unnamed protein product [Phaedon cochleariae]|uniref:USP domain-containing protein n=1 Tax=Phaedon cochleariae TaxID=80249 RepID=A0A9N9X2J4_PHACE|nr:unnamed protein product [Phaedon cochleariae]